MTPRETLLAALPDWALVIETGMESAPYVGFHRFGNRVFATTITVEDGIVGFDTHDQNCAMAQLCAQVSDADQAVYGTSCLITVFDDERDAQTFMRDVKRLSRQHGCVVARGAECEIPI